MLESLRKLPALFATTAPSTNITLMTQMGASTETLVFYACTPDGKSFKKECTEQVLEALRSNTASGKSPAMAWDRFFDEIAIAFNNSRVECESVAADSVNIAVGLAGDAHIIKFALAPTSENCQKLIFDGLLFFHFVHSSTKEAERQYEEIVKKETSLKQTANDLAKEEAMLTDVINRSKEHEVANKKKLVELEAALKVTKETHGELMDENNRSGTLGSAIGSKESALDKEDEVCRFRDPLFGKSRKDYDVEVLRLVRSKCEPAASQEPGNTTAIVRPYTVSEFAQHTKNWSNPMRQQLFECLNKLHDWDYDVFKLQTIMSGDDHYSLASQPSGGSLFITFYALMMTHNMFKKFKMDEQVMLNFISVMEAGYHGNPYHNSMHAADVLHIANYILTKGKLIEKAKLTDEDVLACLLAAAIHDFDHPGVNNSFHIRAQTHFAVLFNDRSILENRHVSSVFELMKLKRFNIFSELTEEQRRDIRDTMVDMVLATDMGLHGKYVAQWKRRIGENHDLHKKDDQRLALSMSLKMADISNCGRPQPIYMRWGAKIADEFYMQGDRERNFGLPCSPFMDRQQPAMARGQISFMNFVVIPMFESISEYLPDMHFSVTHTEENKAYWNQHPDD